jgi:hypothetical protein
MGLLKTAAKVAVASHVHGKVQRRQSQRWAAQDAAAAAVPLAPQAGPVQVTPAPSPSTTDDMLAQLAKLGELRTAGVLTDAEFETQKARILAQ